MLNFANQTTIRPYNVITLCGSTKFKDEFLQAQKDLAKKGNVVISVCQFSKADDIKLTDEENKLFKLLHLQKIDMADEIFVINKGLYIGETTLEEIDYAIEKGKKISLLEEHEYTRIQIKAKEQDARIKRLEQDVFRLSIASKGGLEKWQ